MPVASLSRQRKLPRVTIESARSSGRRKRSARSFSLSASVFPNSSAIAPVLQGLASQSSTPALPDTINEVSICGLVFEFLISVHGALASGAQRGFNGRPEFFLLRRQFQTSMEGSDSRIEECSTVGIRELMLLRGRRKGGGVRP